MIHKSSVLILTLFALLPTTASAQVNSNAQIQHLSEQLIMGNEAKVEGVSLATVHLIPELYSRREFTPAWTDDDKVDEFLRVIGAADKEGLDPRDYLLDELSSLVKERRQNPNDTDLQGELDVLLTESFGRYGNHLLFGKVDPTDLDENWNWVQTTEGLDPATAVQQAIDSESIEGSIKDFLGSRPYLPAHAGDARRLPRHQQLRRLAAGWRRTDAQAWHERCANSHDSPATGGNRRISGR